MQGLMMDRPLMVSSLIQYAAQVHGDTEIVSRATEGFIHRYTYAECEARSRKLAQALIHAGVKPGDRVATVAWNSWRHLELYYAISGIGAVCHTINPRLSPDQLIYIVNHAEDKVLFFDKTFTPLITPLSPKMETVDQFVLMTDADNMPECGIPGIRDYESFIGGETGDYVWPEFDENHAAGLCYTSGTTGHPKGVLYSHRSTVLHAYACSLSSGFGGTAHDTVLPVVPMFHVCGWGVPYGAPMSGTRIVFPGPGMDGPSLFEQMDSENVTLALGVPTVWMALLAEMREQGRKPRSLQRVVVGGAAVSEAMINEFQEDFNVTVQHAWGMTETSPLGVFNVSKPKFDNIDEEASMKRQLKQGRQVFGIDLRTVDDDGQVLPRDGETAGHLQARGNWVTNGYFKHEGGDILTEDGWFDTGDIATLDADGYMQITDRSKDVVKSGGEWISSVDLENAAMGHPGVAHAAVIGVPHPKWQERPLIIIVPGPDGAPNLDELNAYLENKVAKYWLPDALEIVDELPIGATGKVLKTKLREQFKEYKLSA